MVVNNISYLTALKDYRFVDLFSGIGGFHLALSSFGAQCVFASDINSIARDTYKRNFLIDPVGDITKINAKDIPAHDILCAGFPCQPFSISGTQGGFNNHKSGKLFYEIIRIAKYHKPKIIVLENVANLAFHNKGESIKNINASLSEAGYVTYLDILNAVEYNVPQYRKRLYIIAFRNDLGILNFSFPPKEPITKHLHDVLETNNPNIERYFIKSDFILRSNFEEYEQICKKPYIRIGEVGKGRQGERVYSIKGCALTLSATSGGLGGRTGLYLSGKKIRKLTERECARLMGFPDSFSYAQTLNQAYQQFGNSVVVDVIQKIVICAIDALRLEGKL